MNPNQIEEFETAVKLAEESNPGDGITLTADLVLAIKRELMMKVVRRMVGELANHYGKGVGEQL